MYKCHYVNKKRNHIKQHEKCDSEISKYKYTNNHIKEKATRDAEM